MSSALCQHIWDIPGQPGTIHGNPGHPVIFPLQAQLCKELNEEKFKNEVLTR